jgi:hypothetical protein
MLGTDLGITSGTLNVTVPTASTTVAGILKVDGTSIQVTSGVASVVGTAPTAAGSVPAASALQLVSTSDTYFTGTQLQTIFDAAGTSAAETTRAQAAEALAAQKANNLSDLASASTARTNLGLGAIATQAIPAAGVMYSTGTAVEPLTLGTNLSLSGSTLNAASSGGGASFPGGSGLVSATGAQVTVSTGLTLSGTTLTGALTSVVGQTGVVTATQIAAALPVAAVGTKGILSVDGTSIAVNGSGVASVVSAAPSGSNATTSTQIVGTGNTYYTVTQLIPAVFPGGASSLVTGTGAALTLGTNLSISGSTLNAAGGGGGTFGTTAGTYAQGNDPRIIGTPVNVTAAGTTQSGAAPLTGQFNLGTLSTGNTAFSLQAIVGEQNFVNTQPVGGLAALIFPLTGSASINGLANTASVSIPGGTSCTFRSADGVNFKVTVAADPMAIGAGAIVSSAMVSGTPYTIPAGTSVQLFSQTTTQAAVTITLPSAPTNGQTLELDNGTGQITAATFSPAIAGWANGSTLTPNSTVCARYFTATSTWQRTQ